MKRQSVILVVLATLLLAALWWLLLYSPQLDEQAELELQRDQVLAEQAQLRQQITQLAAVRETAPELEARLLNGETLIPREAGLPALLRQLQLAGEESGLVLRSISVGRPVAIGEPSTVTPGAQLSSIQLSMSIEGGYFQLVDLLRRFEDPSITGRGLITQTLSLAPAEYPELSASVTMQAYAVIPPSLDPAAEIDGQGEIDGNVPADGEAGEPAEADGEADAETEDAS